MSTNGSHSFSVSFTLDVDVARCTVDQLQRDLRRESRRALARALLEVIKEVDGARASETAPCTRCGGRVRSRGRTSRRIVTMFGVVVVRRARYACIRCRTVHRPLDDWLLDGFCGEYSRTVCEQVLYLAAELPYERAAEVLQHVTGVAVSGRQIQRLLQAERALLTRAGITIDEEPSPPDAQPRSRRRAGGSATVVTALRQLKTSGQWSSYWTSADVAPPRPTTPRPSAR